MVKRELLEVLQVLRQVPGQFAGRADDAVARDRGDQPDARRFRTDGRRGGAQAVADL
jgi:hypothetical protein